MYVVPTLGAGNKQPPRQDLPTKGEIILTNSLCLCKSHSEVFQTFRLTLRFGKRRSVYSGNILRCTLRFVMQTLGQYAILRAIGHFKTEQGTGASCKFDPIYKLTPPYKRSC